MFLVAKNAFSANPVLIYKSPVDKVVKAYCYYKFLDEYQAEFRNLNNPSES